jgi:hypothetical protein
MTDLERACLIITTILVLLLFIDALAPNFLG